MAAPVLKKYFEILTTDSSGLIDLTGPLNVAAHNTIRLEVAQWPDAGVAMTVQCDMGVISGSAHLSTVAQFPLASEPGLIRTFNVTGSEFRVLLTGGPANAAIPIEGWVFLH